MFRRILPTFVTLIAAVTAISCAAALSPKPQGTEVAFVAGIQKDLNARFATEAAAEQAGYFRYNNEDDTGAISYVNLQQWNSVDPQHPSQLWYDVNGNLLGADFSRPDQPKAPVLWGVLPARWYHFKKPHVHYVYSAVGGKTIYGHAVSGTKFVAAGGDLANPQAATLVKLGRVKGVQQVLKVFTYPAEWDLIVWIKPNPDGAFADKNPLVKPSATADKDSM